MTKPWRIEKYRAADGWRWRMRAGNNRIVADSGEAYRSRENCQGAIRRLLDAMGEATCHTLKPA